MAYRLAVGKPLARRLSRSLRQQLDKALGQLAASGDPAPRVHEARKCLKRSRALLRLIRDGLPAGMAKDYDRRLGEIGRMLSGTRDVDVLGDTVTKLETRGGLDPADAAAIRRLVDRIRTGHTTANARTAARTARRELGKVAHALGELDSISRPRHVIRAGLADTHKRGRERVKLARANASDENLHALRKAVQRHWRQMSLMIEAWPEVVGGRVGEARQISELLGDHHDIAVLAARIAEADAKDFPEDARSRIQTACRERQSVLAAEALERARRLFAGQPEALARQILRWWQSASRLHAAAPRGEEPTAGNDTASKAIASATEQ